MLIHEFIGAAFSSPLNGLFDTTIHSTCQKFVSEALQYELLSLACRTNNQRQIVSPLFMYLPSP